MAKSSKVGPKLSLAELRTYEPHFSLTHVGDYDACIMVFAIDATQVASLLPSNLELRPQSITPTGQHPVLLFVGEQSRVRGENVPGALCPWLGPIGLCMDFMETAIAIPCVHQVGASASSPDHFCSVTMYLNQLLPIFLGWLCGFPKRRGILNATPNRYEVTTLTSAPLLELTVTPSGGFHDPSAFPNFAGIQPLFEQPHIGQIFSAMVELVSSYVCADIDLKLASARIQSIGVSGTLTDSFSSILPNKFSLAGIKDDPLGAFRLRTTWELAPPNSC